MSPGYLGGLMVEVPPPKKKAVYHDGVAVDGFEVC